MYKLTLLERKGGAFYAYLESAFKREVISRRDVFLDRCSLHSTPWLDSEDGDKFCKVMVVEKKEYPFNELASEYVFSKVVEDSIDVKDGIPTTYRINKYGEEAIDNLVSAFFEQLEK